MIDIALHFNTTTPSSLRDDYLAHVFGLGQPTSSLNCKLLD